MTGEEKKLIVTAYKELQLSGLKTNEALRTKFFELKNKGLTCGYRVFCFEISKCTRQNLA